MEKLQSRSTSTARYWNSNSVIKTFPLYPSLLFCFLTGLILSCRQGFLHADGLGVERVDKYKQLQHLLFRIIPEKKL